MSFTPGAGTRFLVSTGASGTTPLSGPLSITGGTATANTPVLSATQTWNNAAVTFTGWQLNVTDTASNAASLLMDLQVGGSSRFNVRKDGTVSAPAYVITGGVSDLGFTYQAGSQINFVSNGARARFGASGWFFASLPLNLGGNLSAGDVVLLSEGAGLFAQRNGVNAQTLRVYNTYTDASNYERGRFAWVSNRLEIGTENAGTGTARDLRLVAGVATLNIQGSGAAAGTITPYFNRFGLANASVIFEPAQGVAWVPSFGNVYQALTLRLFAAATGTGLRIDAGVTTTGAFLEFVEQTAPAAPAANSVRIYAEDNGSGKTRLMALFATGAAQQIAIEP